MSIKMYVCNVHDGVQMILSVGSHTKCLQMRVYPNIGPTTIELEVSTHVSDQHLCGKNPSSCICNNVTFKVSSKQEAKGEVSL